MTKKLPGRLKCLIYRTVLILPRTANVFHFLLEFREQFNYLSFKGLAKLTLGLISSMNGDSLGKPPKPPLKGTNSLEAGPLLGRKDTKRKGVFSPFTFACTHTYPHAHTYTHTHTQVHNARTQIRTQPYTHACTYTKHAHVRARTHTRTRMHTNMHVRAHTHTCARTHSTRVHTHVGAAQRTRRPSHRLALCLLIKCCPLPPLHSSHWDLLIGFFQTSLRCRMVHTFSR